MVTLSPEQVRFEADEARDVVNVVLHQRHLHEQTTAGLLQLVDRVAIGGRERLELGVRGEERLRRHRVRGAR